MSSATTKILSFLNYGRKSLSFKEFMAMCLYGRFAMSGKKGIIGRRKVRNTIELKKEIIAKYENGARVSELGRLYGKSASTITSILAKKNQIKAANVSIGVTLLSKQRPQIMEDVEKLLVVWISERQLAGDNISERHICQKALTLHEDLLSKMPEDSRSGVNSFKASKGWFEKFKKRTGMDGVKRQEAQTPTTIPEIESKLKNKWKGLRDTFRQELKKSPQPTPWAFYQDMSFLKDHMKSKVARAELEGDAEETGNIKAEPEENNSVCGEEEKSEVKEEMDVSDGELSNTLAAPETALYTKTLEPDDDYHFLMSFLPEMRKLHPRKKMFLRMKMMELFFNEIYQQSFD